MGKNLSAIAAVVSHLKTDLFHVNVSGIDKQITADNILAGRNLPKPPKNWGQTNQSTDNGVWITNGMLLGSTLNNIPDTAVRTTNGQMALAETAASTGSSKGGRCPTNASVFRRVENPLIQFAIRLTTTTVQRFFFGFYGGTGTIANNDDQLNAIHGFGIAQITTSANYQIAHNDGVGATVFDDTGIAVDTTYRTWILRAKSDDTGFEWNVNGGSFTSVTTNVPASATNLGFQFIQITNENVVKGAEWHYIYAENDK